jgi:hypothetical protein
MSNNILLGPAAICGCGGNVNNFQCCQVADLGMIYEEEPEYSANNPCKPTRTDEIITPEEGEPYCESTPDAEPYGQILDYTRACARLVVWTKAKIINRSIFGQRYVLYSRQRDDLPTENCQNPILCPAENEIYTCCAKEWDGFSDNQIQLGGPYNGCSLNEEDCEVNCDDATPQIYKFGVSNCSLNGKVLAGYAIAPDNWWFLDSDEYQNVEEQIIENNPYGEADVTIYAHFQLEWKPIRCKTNGGLVGSPCNGEGKINTREGRCGGESNIQGLSDKDEREKAVKITAAIGWSLGDCGYTPQNACNKI